MMYIWQSRLATTCNFLFFGESRWKIALRCITPGWWARMQFRFVANYKLSWLRIKVKVLWKQSDTIRIIFGDIKFSLSSTWDLWDQTREMKYIVAKAAKLEDVKAKLMKKGSAISPAHWSNPPCSAKSVKISPKYPWPWQVQMRCWFTWTFHFHFH